MFHYDPWKVILNGPLIYIHMGFVKSIVSRATLNVIYGNGKVPTCIISGTSLIIAHAATNLLYLSLV